MRRHSTLAETRKLYAQMMAAASGSLDPRFERAFELVPREAFLPPGPWHIMVNGRYIETPSADPSHLCQNALVAIDAAKGINNGEPLLHAAWIGVAGPARGDVVSHIGAGTGYYTAILSMLVLPGGTVHAFEIDAELAGSARRNLEPFEGIAITCGDASKLSLPVSDIVYVNAGVTAPPGSWLQSLPVGGRIVFPWQPTSHAGLAMILHREKHGFRARPFMPVLFIPCFGASQNDDCTKVPTMREAWSVRSVWLTEEREPDDTAVAIYRDLWFSSDGGEIRVPRSIRAAAR
jgi:protein-L-isoaspartate(D-aspartate) O-methyltransferase